MREPTAVVNRILPFSSVDGPGNRTAIFLQGCNIDCKYCHNPETRALCINCGECVPACPAKALSFGPSGEIRYDAARCVRCDTCIRVCPHDSSPKTTVMTPSEVLKVVRRSLPFIRGITVSGGECMLWPDWMRVLFENAKKEGLGTLIDSNGMVPFEEYPELLRFTDGVMLDIKAFSSQDHMQVTGHSNEMVLKNALYLGETGKLAEVRCVIAPDLYDAGQSIAQMGEFLLPVYQKKAFRIKLITFRPMGVRKAYAGMKIPAMEEMKALSGLLQELGYENIVIC